MWLWMRHGSTTMMLKPKFKVCSGNKCSPTPKKFKLLPSEGKVLLSVFWDAQGVVMVDYLQRGETITGLYYTDLIHKLRNAIKDKHHGKWSFFIKTTPQVTGNGCDFHSMLWIAGPSTYSSELTPSDYRLFPKLEEHLCGKKYSSDNEVMLSVNQWFAEVGQPFFQEAVEMLENHWEKCVNLLGDYEQKLGKNNFFPTILSGSGLQHRDHPSYCLFFKS